MGVGPGTVAVCAFGIIGLIICFFKDCTQTPALMVTVGIILPLLVLLIVWFIPKQDLRTDTQKEAKLPTDSYKKRTGIFSALIFLVCFFVSLLMCFGKITTVIGQRVDSELADINNAKRLKNIQQQVRNESLKQDNEDIEAQDHHELMGEPSPQRDLSRLHDDELNREFNLPSIHQEDANRPFEFDNNDEDHY